MCWGGEKIKNLIENAVEEAAAIRATLQLQPAGGKGAKVFPPRYQGERNTAEYAFEERKLKDGGVVQCVLLDSVQSQANRMKRALLEAVRKDKLDLPIIQVEFDSGGVKDVVTHLEAPHGIADALFVNSNLEGEPFRETEYGDILYKATKDDALSLFRICPTALLYGFWDSRTEVGSGNSFQRNISSEIVGIDVEEGLSPAGRMSELGITGTEKEIYLDENGQITYEEEEGVTDAKSPADVGLGNIPPSAYDEGGEKKPGGVTMERAELTSVVSLSGIRTISFSNGEREEDEELNCVCRAILATLGMAGQKLQHETGYSLRSRCSLVPQDELKFEIVSKKGESEEVNLSVDEIFEIFEGLTERAEQLGAGWEFEELSLEPAEGIKETIDRSQMEPGG